MGVVDLGWAATPLGWMTAVGLILAGVIGVVVSFRQIKADQTDRADGD